MLRFKRHLSETARVISSDYFIHTHTHTHTHTPAARRDPFYFLRAVSPRKMLHTKNEKKLIMTEDDDDDDARLERVLFSSTKRLRRLSSPSHRLVRKRTRTMRSSTKSRGISRSRTDVVRFRGKITPHRSLRKERRDGTRDLRGASKRRIHIRVSRTRARTRRTTRLHGSLDASEV